MGNRCRPPFRTRQALAHAGLEPRPEPVDAQSQRVEGDAVLFGDPAALLDLRSSLELVVLKDQPVVVLGQRSQAAIEALQAALLRLAFRRGRGHDPERPRVAGRLPSLLPRLTQDVARELVEVGAPALGPERAVATQPP